LHALTASRSTSRARCKQQNYQPVCCLTVTITQTDHRSALARVCYSHRAQQLCERWPRLRHGHPQHDYQWDEGVVDNRLRAHMHGVTLVHPQHVAHAADTHTTKVASKVWGPTLPYSQTTAGTCFKAFSTSSLLVAMPGANSRCELCGLSQERVLAFQTVAAERCHRRYTRRRDVVGRQKWSLLAGRSKQAGV